MRYYELRVVRCPEGGWWLLDDEGNREWFSSRSQAERHAGRYLVP